MCGSIPKATLTSFFSSWVSLIVARFEGPAPAQPQESDEDQAGAKEGNGETEGPILHGGGPEGLQDPEGLALGLAPAEDLV